MHISDASTIKDATHEFLTLHLKCVAKSISQSAYYIFFSHWISPHGYRMSSDILVKHTIRNFFFKEDRVELHKIIALLNNEW